MSIGNTKDNGNKGNNFPYQLKNLQLLACIAENTASAAAGCCPSVTRTPSLLRTSAPGVVAAGARSVSVFNAGVTNGTWLGAVIKPGEQFSYEAGSTSDLLAAFAYDGTGAELVITSVV